MTVAAAGGRPSGWLIRPPARKDHPQWARLRAGLYPDGGEPDDVLALRDADDGVRTRAWLGCDDQDQVIAFAEASLRHDYVNGTASSPVGFLEGWYVVPQWRGRGLGAALLAAAEQWAREHGCSEFASDSLLDNRAAHAAHRACGFEETERVVYFRKPL